MNLRGHFKSLSWLTSISYFLLKILKVEQDMHMQCSNETDLEVCKS